MLSLKLENVANLLDSVGVLLLKSFMTVAFFVDDCFLIDGCFVALVHVVAGFGPTDPFAAPEGGEIAEAFRLGGHIFDCCDHDYVFF